MRWDSKKNLKDTKGVIRIRKLQKDRQHNDQKKKVKKTEILLKGDYCPCPFKNIYSYNHKTYDDKLFLVYIDPKLIIIFYIKNTNKF